LVGCQSTAVGEDYDYGNYDDDYQYGGADLTMMMMLMMIFKMEEQT